VPPNGLRAYFRNEVGYTRVTQCGLAFRGKQLLEWAQWAVTSGAGIGTTIEPPE